MFLWTLQVVFISFVTIWVCHMIFIFFIDNLTTPKVRDLVDLPVQKYDDIFRQISNNVAKTSTYIDDLPMPVYDESNKMKDELKMFLKSGGF